MVQTVYKGIGNEEDKDSAAESHRGMAGFSFKRGERELSAFFFIEIQVVKDRNREVSLSIGRTAPIHLEIRKSRGTKDFDNSNCLSSSTPVLFSREEADMAIRNTDKLVFRHSAGSSMTLFLSFLFPVFRYQNRKRVRFWLRFVQAERNSSDLKTRNSGPS